MNIIGAPLFFVRLRTHSRVVYLHCIKNFSIRNFFIGITYFIVLSLVMLTNIVTRLLDEILFPNYRHIEIKQPIFIISNPRSGTTFLHRLMCLDDEKYVSTLMYQTIWPSITLYRIIQVFASVDNKIGKPLHKLMDMINERFFEAWEDIHETGFNKSEEDEGLHFVSGISASVGLANPQLKEFKELYIPDNLDENSREKIKKFYKATAQRWMYALGSDKLFLSKSVMSSGRLELLHDIFPDIKIIFLIRNPYQAIPSFTSMFAESWPNMFPTIPKVSEEYREWGEVGISYYKYFNEEKSKFKKENFITISYTDLIAQPKETVLKIYDQLKLNVSPTFLDVLEKETTKSRHYSSKHTYSLEEYGFDKDHIYNELEFIFEEFGFEK
jgi:hypothetical protein